MKNVISVDSNLKSEDTSLDSIFKLYEFEVKARDILAKEGYEFVDFKEAINVWHKAEIAKLLKPIIELGEAGYIEAQEALTRLEKENE